MSKLHDEAGVIMQRMGLIPEGQADIAVVNKTVKDHVVGSGKMFLDYDVHLTEFIRDHGDTNDSQLAQKREQDRLAEEEAKAKEEAEAKAKEETDAKAKEEADLAKAIEEEEKAKAEAASTTQTEQQNVNQAPQQGNKNNKK